MKYRLSPEGTESLSRGAGLASSHFRGGTRDSARGGGGGVAGTTDDDGHLETESGARDCGSQQVSLRVAELGVDSQMS